jgi:uncharacterized protein YjdB
VVNEPINDPPDEPGNGGGNYINALGGSGSTGWDWVIEAFRLARKYFPNTVLMINEYGIVASISNTQNYIEIIELLQAEDTLIDAIGVQAHAFSTGGSSSTISNSLNLLEATGLPVYATEMDIDGITDQYQLEEYQRIFPLFWEHPAVKGVTLWGYRPGMWRTSTGAYLINADGTERPAIVWLRAYVQGTFIPVDSITVTSSGGITEINTDNGTLQLNVEILPENATLKNVYWRVNNIVLVSISSSGLLTAIGNGTVTVTATAGDGSGVTGTLDISIINQVTGIEDLENTGKFVIYPNPVVSGSFTIQGIESITKVTVVDLTGTKVKELNVMNQSSIDIKLDIEPGIYIIQLFDGQRFIFRKFVVE